MAEIDGGPGNWGAGSVQENRRKAAERAAASAREATEVQFRGLLAEVRHRLATAERDAKRAREKALSLERELRAQRRVSAGLAEEVQRLGGRVMPSAPPPPTRDPLMPGDRVIYPFGPGEGEVDVVEACPGGPRVRVVWDGGGATWQAAECLRRLPPKVQP